MGLGFEKFATGTGQGGGNRQKEEIDDFDFGNLSNNKKEEGKEEDSQFNFDVP